jgi:heat shock protein HslJ
MIVRGGKFWIVSLILCGLLLFTLSSCMGRRAADELESSKWILTAYAVDGAMKDALATPQVDAVFVDGKVSGSGGINQYSGSYETDGSKLKVGALASTQMAGDPAVMQQEAAYLQNLGKSAAFRVDGDKLTIKDVSANVLLEFRAG